MNSVKCIQEEVNSYLELKQLFLAQGGKNYREKEKGTRKLFH